MSAIVMPNRQSGFDFRMRENPLRVSVLTLSASHMGECQADDEVSLQSMPSRALARWPEAGERNRPTPRPHLVADVDKGAVLPGEKDAA